MKHPHIIRQALIDTLPLCLPAVPFAFVIGLAIISAGINPVVGWSSSWLIFGGAAQMTLISLLGSGVTAIAAIGAALVVNARHLMYSGAIAPSFQQQPRWMQFFGPYLLIDQVFALAMLRTAEHPDAFRIYYLTAGFTFWVIWQITTAFALLVGPQVPESWHLQFAVPVLFLGLIVLGIDKPPKLVAALVGAGVTLACIELPNRTGLLVGAVAGVAAGIIAERIKP
ncbi:AzlC family ABC transporter permease [Porticoccus sp. W117]|uniref:AzlC family ABC transporter permease n=1 Tax=Porticoccus sp. W117 TaxID=3054777 RepID=UPI0025933853|nr:AzlC family ABC transporter permease [Porticoccus sp. W117]MDM3870124.1 AzlC family ABC transporter permease [Porticoccus sp. W117]